MKRSWIIIVLIFIGCNEDMADKAIENREPNTQLEVEQLVLDDFSNNKKFSELDIIEEKLQEAYDISHYTQNNEFEIPPNSSFLERHKNFGSLKTKVSNIKKTGNTQIINDSISSVIFVYDLLRENQQTKDTLKAIFRRKKIKVDQIETFSIKVDFEKF